MRGFGNVSAAAKEAQRSHQARSQKLLIGGYFGGVRTEPHAAGDWGPGG